MAAFSSSGSRGTSLRVYSPAVPRTTSPNAAWWKTGVFYQIYPRSFADVSGDGIGDLAGIQAHLDYLVWLGVDAIWISPFYRPPMRDYGYDVADYCDVDPLFGTLAEADAPHRAVHGGWVS